MTPGEPSLGIDRECWAHMRSIGREIAAAVRASAVAARFRWGAEMLGAAGHGDRVPELADEFVRRYGVTRDVLMPERQRASA